MAEIDDDLDKELHALEAEDAKEQKYIKTMKLLILAAVLVLAFGFIASCSVG